jgi:hypothetical protein
VFVVQTAMTWYLSCFLSSLALCPEWWDDNSLPDPVYAAHFNNMCTQTATNTTGL